nr:hypothetical protein [Tanacetum cinerariifolium]
MVKNELRNEMKTSIQTSLSNQTNEIMMASLLPMNTVSTSGSGTLPGNTIANPKGELKAITTRSGLVTEGPTVPNPPKPVNPEEDECVEETYTDPDHAEYNIKQEKDDMQIQKFWNMFKQLHLNITLAEALVLMPKYQKMLKALLSNKEKLQELANTPLNKNCSAMTLELANRAICTPDGIARDVFVPVGKFIFPADFVVVNYESDPRVPLILGRPFLRTARALIDVHGEEMILRDGDERLTLNMKHDTASYSNHPYRESVNLINIFNLSSEDCLKDLVSNKQSGNPTFSLHKEIASPEVILEFHDSKGCTFLSEELPDIDSFNDIHPYFDADPLSGSTTYSANSLLEEFADELALISYPPDYDDYREMFADEQPPDYSFPPRFDVYPDDLLEIESDATFDDDSFNSEGEKIKEAELLIDQLDLPCDILSEYDSFNSQDFPGMMFCSLLIMRTRSNLSVVVDKTKSFRDGLKTVHADLGTNKEFRADDILKKIKLEDLSEFSKDTRFAFFTPDSPQDEPITVTNKSEEEDTDKEETHDTSHDKLKTLQSHLLHLQNHLKFKKLQALPVLVSSVQNQLKTLDSLSSLLNKITKTLNRFATVVENVSEATTNDVSSAGQATALPSEGEKNTKDADA